MSFTPIPRAEPTVLTGTRGPENAQAVRIVPDVFEKIIFLNPEASPFTVITSYLRDRKPCTQVRYDFFEKDEFPRRVTLSADSAVLDTALDVQAGQGVRMGANAVFMNLRTREQVLVTAMASADVATVTRGIGGPEEDMVTGDELEYQGSISEDGASLGPMKSVKEENYWNYTETVRTPYGFTGRDLVTKFYGGADKEVERQHKAIEHLTSIEYRFLFGRRHLMTGTHQRTFTGGLEYFIKSNIWDLNNNIPQEEAFIDYLGEVMRYGGNGNQNGVGRKWMFASRRWLTIIERFARNKIQYRPMDDRVGIKVGFFDTSQGTLILVPTPILNGNPHGGWAFIVDLDQIRFRYLNGRDTMLKENVQAPDEDANKEEWLTDFGAEVHMEMAHGILKGLPMVG